VILELVALGVISAVRPSTSQAAVVALLRAPGASRLLLAFSVAGFTASAVVGIVIVVAFHGAGQSFGHSRVAAVFDVFAGVTALALAVRVRRRRVSPLGRRENGTPRLAARLARPSTAAASVAGVATHVPGLVYLVALNAIAAQDLGAAESASGVLLYNALWFALPLAALALSVVAPGTADAYLERATVWARAREDSLVVVIFAGLGVYLVGKGVVSL
jgi:hypothetical protein